MWKKIVEYLQNLLIPEDKKVQKILNLSPYNMRDLLPKSPLRLPDISVIFDYQNQIVRLMVKTLKYKNNASLRERLALYLHDELIDIVSEIALFDGSLPIVVPMPMSKMEKRKRGFNQCEELLRRIQKLDSNMNISYNILQKIRETERQTRLGREQRALNVKNSMAVTHTDLPKIKNTTIVVLDDVYTTGASFAEARRALLSAGAKKVVGLFIAH